MKISTLGGLPAAALAFCALAVAAPAGAATLYNNFDPTLAAPVDYTVANDASLSGSCSNVTCLWINVLTVGFTFTPVATGNAGFAYLPFRQTFVTPGGAENIYGLTITDSDGDIVARGGFYQHDIANITLAGTEIVQMALYASTSVGQSVANGVLDANAPLLTAGQTYTAYFQQSYGSLSSAYWELSDEVPANGQATQYCRTNVGGECAYWGGASWISIPDAPITTYLPALAITDANGFQQTTSTPEPMSLALLGFGLAGLTVLRRRA